MSISEAQGVRQVPGSMNLGASKSCGVSARLGRCLVEEGASACALFEAADTDGSGAPSRTELRRLVNGCCRGCLREICGTSR
jgi:hypothetical protein